VHSMVAFWLTAGSARTAKRLEIALLGMVVTVGFSAALRGEEIPKRDLGGCLQHRDQSRGKKELHVTLALRGRQAKRFTWYRWRLYPTQG
jgi:hypothetical protein